jgi:hypothetical protein
LFSAGPTEYAPGGPVLLVPGGQGDSQSRYHELETFVGTVGAAYTITSGLSDNGGTGTGTCLYQTGFAPLLSECAEIIVTTSSTFSRRMNFGDTNVPLVETWYTLSFWFDTLPSANTPIANTRAAGVNTSQLVLNSAGTFSIRDGGTPVFTTTATLATNTLYTIEQHINFNTGLQEMWLSDRFGNLIEAGGGTYVGSAPDAFQFGLISAPGNTGTWRYARWGYSTVQRFGAPVLDTAATVPISDSDTLALTDAFSAIVANLSATETLTGSDATSVQQAVFSATESLALADAFAALAAVNSAAETLTLTDAVNLLDTGGGATPISASETLTLTDAVSLLTVTLSAAETLTLTDAVGARSATLSATETLSLADAAFRVGLTASETLSLVDASVSTALTAAEVLALTDTRGATSLSAAETLSFAEAYTDRSFSQAEFLLLADGVGALVKTGGPAITLLLLPYRERPRRNRYGSANTRIAP